MTWRSLHHYLDFLGICNFNPESYEQAAKLVMSEELASPEENRDYCESDNDDDDDDEIDVEQSNADLSVQRCRKIQSIFQILYYIHHCGRKENTPSYHECRIGS